MAEPLRRLFFGLWPSAAVAAQLHREALSLQRACGGRAMREESLHLTLAFLGGVPASRLQAAEAAADAVRAGRFILELDRAACWKHNRIAWAGCSAVPPELSRLVADLSAQLRVAGFTLDDRPFAVHATLVRNADCRRPLPPLASPIAWPVEDLVLVESRVEPGGSRYEIVRRWPMH
ncbi:MAG TPA: RNA 2',3'-cyclic phosphodiesterase [Rhodocyclaceae bacterium]